MLCGDALYCAFVVSVFVFVLCCIVLVLCCVELVLYLCLC